MPLLLRLVRRGANRGKLRSAGLLLHLLGQRLGHVRLLLDAWFMRAWLIHRALTAGHTVIGCVRRDLALFEVPKPPRKRRQGRPLKYGVPADAGAGCGIAGAPQRPDPLRQAGSRAIAPVELPRGSCAGGWCGRCGWNWSVPTGATNRASSGC